MESNGRTATSNDPWQDSTASAWQPPPPPQVNAWGGHEHTTANHDNNLSISLSDPWGVGSTNSRPTTTTTSPPPTTNTIDNELSDFFGASASNISYLFFSISSYLHS